MEQHPRNGRPRWTRPSARSPRGSTARACAGSGSPGSSTASSPWTSRGGHPPGEALVRHEHGRRVRDPDPEAGRPRRRHPETGLPFLPGYTAPKVLWLKRHEPANFRRLRHILLPHDYLNLHLTGNYFMEFGDASGTGFLDVRRRAWSAAAMGAVDGRVADCLPALSASHEPCGAPARGRGRYGFPKGTIVSAGGGDNMMGAIGTGNVAPAPSRRASARAGRSTRSQGSRSSTPPARSRRSAPRPGAGCRSCAR
jgi:hypothetical protein